MAIGTIMHVLFILLNLSFKFLGHLFELKKICLDSTCQNSETKATWHINFFPFWTLYEALCLEESNSFGNK